VSKSAWTTRKKTHSWGLGRDIIGDSIDTSDFIGDSGGNPSKNLSGEHVPIRVVSVCIVTRIAIRTHQSAVIKSSDCTARRAIT